MPEVALDSSVAIGLLFRHAGERDACRAPIPEGATVVCSRYVQFEIARGFLRSLIALHNLSFAYASFADLHLAAHSGPTRFKPYQMHTWLGAFDDFEAALEAEDGTIAPSQKLDEFRAKLRGWVRRGWARLQKDFAAVNPIGCRETVKPPFLRSDGHLDQVLDVDRCGDPTACRLPDFIQCRKGEMAKLAAGLAALPVKLKDVETKRRIEALRSLMAGDPRAEFDGTACHHCGDGFIVIESPHDCVILTKNVKHFEPIAAILGKKLAVVTTPKSTKGSDLGR